jgi:SAM-dependent methyltransferase
VAYGIPDQGGKLDPRIFFYLRLLAERGSLRPELHLVDVGAGTSWFGPVAQEFGMRVTLVDDFAGGGGVPLGAGSQEALALIDAFESRLGIRVVRQDVLSQPLPLTDSSVDVVTCFNSLEHWHHSPKRLFHELVRVLRPGGIILVATPNAANLRKRLFALFGANIFDRLEWWYDEGDPVFRGHVREPIVSDLHQIFKWNGFEIQGTYGRNFIGRGSKSLAFLPAWCRLGLATAADLVLRPFPTLCSDIFVLGRKP